MSEMQINRNFWKMKYILIFFLFCLLIYLFILRSKPQQMNHDNKINVIVSILPQKEFVEKVGGDKVLVQELIHPGESPATYSPTINDLKIIENADIYFRIGYIPFEQAHLESIKDINPNLKIINIPENIDIRYFDFNEKYSDNTIDQHIWLSIPNVKKHVVSIMKELSNYDLDNKKYFSENADKYLQELDSLNIQLIESLTEIKNKNIIVFHPSWGYFTDAYGFTQIAIEQEGHEPTIQQLADVINLAKTENIRVIFVQKQFSRSVANSVASEINGVVVSIDPLAKNYIANMQIIANKLKQNL